MADTNHRLFAVQAFNACWEIIERQDATIEDYRELLTVAFTSRWHWGFAGGLDQQITGDWMISRAASLYGDHALARDFIDRAWNSLSPESPDWLRASVAEGQARAATLANDPTLSSSWVTQARELVTAIANDDDRAVIVGQLAEIDN
jgi:hypothetical protein